MKDSVEAFPQAMPPDLVFPNWADLPMAVDPRPQLEEINQLFAQLPTAKDPAAIWEEITRLSLLLPEADGIPMETFWHYLALCLLLELVEYHFRGRNDYVVGGNQFLYYSTSRSLIRDFLGPDFFYVSGVSRHPIRDRWIVWLENDRFPNVIIELQSISTAGKDLKTKKAIYEQTFQTPEYFCFDRRTNRLEGWRLQSGRYQAILTNERGWMWSEQLQLWVGTWEGVFHGYSDTWLRFYNPPGPLVLIEAEAERRNAEVAQQQAEAERQRAETAETELARLRALLAQKGPASETPEKPS